MARVKRQDQTRTTHRVSSLRAFWRPENTIAAESWNSRSRLRSFVRTHFLHFGRLKMWFLPSRETHASRVCSFVWTIFSFMATLKCDSYNTMTKFKGHAKRPIRGRCRKSKVKVKHERHIAWAHFVHFGAWVLKLTFKGTRLRANSFSAFWRRKNAIFAESWNPWYKSS